MNIIANFKFQFLLLFLACVVTSCTSTKQTNLPKDESMIVPQNVVGCNAVAIVRNYTHEAGCQYLFELSDKTLILPGEMPNNQVAFYEGAGLKIGYELLNVNKNVVAKTACNSHKYIAKITCMEQYVIPQDGLPDTHDGCESIKNPYKFKWMQKAITEHQPTKVLEYKYTIGYLYEFIDKNKTSYLYDCLGSQMCTTSDNQDCTSLIETLTNPITILVSNN